MADGLKARESAKKGGAPAKRPARRKAPTAAK
jgi:hypothetical protein